LIEPEVSGKEIVAHILATSPAEVAGKFYARGKEEKAKKKLINGGQDYDRLIAFSEEVTGVSMNDYLPMKAEQTE